MRTIKIMCGLCLMFFCSICMPENAQTQDKMNLILTYNDGSKQSVNLNQPSENIVKIEFARGLVGKEYAPSTAEIRYVKGFEGKWNTNWGVLEFRADGIKAHGNYTHDQGKIEATLSKDGRTMEGMWMEYPSYSPPNDGGRVTFKLSDNGNNITGWWWYGQDSGGGDWTGTRIK